MVKLDYEQSSVFQRFKIEGYITYSKLKQLLLEVGWDIYDIDYDVNSLTVFNGKLIMPGYNNRPVGRIGLVKNCAGKDFDGKLHYLCVEYEYNYENKDGQNGFAQGVFTREDIDSMRTIIINRIQRAQKEA
jgi:hypothetical protein